ncbi:MAG: outer membrane protein assembly factor BamB [Pseudomonadota bacterium]
MKSIKVSKAALVGLLVLFLSGCTTISNWFADDEEVEIRTLLPLQNQFEPQVLWDKSIGDGTDEFFSSLRPAFDYGKVFAADRAGRIYALDPDDGDRIWRQDISERSKERRLTNLYGLFAGRIPAKVSGGLTVGYRSVFFGTENGEVVALNESDGSVKWRTRVTGEVLAPPAIDEGIVIVNTVAGLLIAIDAESGEIKWQNENDVPPLSLRGISAPAAANGGAIVGTASGRLIVNLIDSGLTAWEQQIAKPTGATELDRIVDIDSTPLVFLGNIYAISYGGALASVEIRTGQVVWNREYASYRDLSLEGNRLFISDINSNLYAVDRRNGVELWSNSALRRRELTSAVPIRGYVAVGDKWGFLHFFNQSDGQYVARVRIGGDDEDEGIFSSPIAFEDKLLVQRKDGDLFLLEVP